jgi:hypothetical protein
MGKQEWVTEIKYIYAAEGALPRIIIFKDKNIDSRWLRP